ncbi:phosphatase PAP2 family protein [Mesorhizobium qingshengii]|uniref:Undecaprenyl-diphosphatase n=1 Tax=Mesorhizobium qingshengii TaxID=1165689 RepID=A0A1G5ZXL5_9HYPH|nr:phosphatase PAP2 family protein [Mesorhizobium qingshengii]SDA99498.1 undecaprenyl-diphosphatase [Mesorhizobium qingshengii]
MTNLPNDSHPVVGFLGGTRRSRLWIAALLLVAAVLIVLVAADAVLKGEGSNFDQGLLMAFRSGGDPANPIGPAWVEGVGRDITSLGSVAFLGVISVATVGFLLIIQRRNYALQLATAVIGGVLISKTIKAAFDLPRQSTPHIVPAFTESFPSGHAMLSAITFLTLGTLVARVSTKPDVKICVLSLAALLTLMVGCSRVYLGIHYPTDVLAGWCVGIGWTILCWFGFRWLEQLSRQKTTVLGP